MDEFGPKQPSLLLSETDDAALTTDLMMKCDKKLQISQSSAASLEGQALADEIERIWLEETETMFNTLKSEAGLKLGVFSATPNAKLKDNITLEEFRAAHQDVKELILTKYGLLKEKSEGLEGLERPEEPPVGEDEALGFGDVPVDLPLMDRFFIGLKRLQERFTSSSSSQSAKQKTQKNAEPAVNEDIEEYELQPKKSVLGWLAEKLNRLFKKPKDPQADDQGLEEILGELEDSERGRPSKTGVENVSTAPTGSATSAAVDPDTKTANTIEPNAAAMELKKPSVQPGLTLISRNPGRPSQPNLKVFTVSGGTPRSSAVPSGSTSVLKLNVLTGISAQIEAYRALVRTKSQDGGKYQCIDTKGGGLKIQFENTELRVDEELKGAASSFQSYYIEPLTQGDQSALEFFAPPNAQGTLDESLLRRICRDAVAAAFIAKQRNPSAPMVQLEIDATLDSRLQAVMTQELQAAIEDNQNTSSMSNVCSIKRVASGPSQTVFNSSAFSSGMSSATSSSSSSSSGSSTSVSPSDTTIEAAPPVNTEPPKKDGGTPSGGTPGP